MFLHRFGRPASTTVVLVHGIPGSAQSWSEVVDALAPDHDVVVPDLLGFGRSTASGDLLPEAQAESLESSLAEAKIHRAVIVGHDFGGPIVMSLYRRVPRLFAGIGLMSTNAFPDTPIPFPLSLVNLPLLGDAMSRVLFSPPALRQMLRRYGGHQLGDPDSVRRIFTRALQDLDGIYGRYPSILRSIDVPASVVWGDSDPFFSTAQAERTAALIPGCHFRLLEASGHFLPEEKPHETAEAIRELVARSSTRA